MRGLPSKEPPSISAEPTLRWENVRVSTTDGDVDAVASSPRSRAAAVATPAQRASDDDAGGNTVVTAAPDALIAPRRSKRGPLIAATVAAVGVLVMTWLGLSPDSPLHIGGGATLPAADAGVRDTAVDGGSARSAVAVDAGAASFDARNAVIDARDGDDDDGAVLPDAGTRVDADAGSKRVRKPKGPQQGSDAGGAGAALQRSLRKARDKCKAVPACAGLPATVDADAPLDELLALRQRARACLEACGQ